MPRSIFALLLLLGGLTLFLYSGYLPPPLLWQLFSLGMIVTAALLLNSIRERPARRAPQNRTAIERLKQEGERIPVALDKCTVKTKRQVQNLVPAAGPKARAWDAIYDPSRNKSETIDIGHAILSYTHEHNGKNEIFKSELIRKDYATLMFLLSAQKTTYIYVDKNDRRRYFFDVDFLYS